MAILTEDDVLTLLLRECRMHGDKAMAARLGLSHTYLINIRKGRKAKHGIGPKLAQALGLEVVYRTRVDRLEKEARWNRKKSA